jgi:hypothetical protein
MDFRDIYTPLSTTHCIQPRIVLLAAASSIFAKGVRVDFRLFAQTV